MEYCRFLHRKILVFAVVGVTLTGITAGIVIWQTRINDDKDSAVKQLPVFPDPSPSEMGAYEKASISCDAPVCANIGK